MAHTLQGRVYSIAQESESYPESCDAHDVFSDALEGCYFCDDTHPEVPGSVQLFISNCRSRWDSSELDSALSVASDYGYFITLPGPVPRARSPRTTQSVRYELTMEVYTGHGKINCLVSYFSGSISLPWLRQ